MTACWSHSHAEGLAAEASKEGQGHTRPLYFAHLVRPSSQLGQQWPGLYLPFTIHMTVGCSNWVCNERAVVAPLVVGGAMDHMDHGPSAIRALPKQQRIPIVEKLPTDPTPFLAPGAVFLVAAPAGCGSPWPALQPKRLLCLAASRHTAARNRSRLS